MTKFTIKDRDGHIKSGFPTMLTSDAIGSFYGFKEGDIIKIIRKEGFVTYREVKKSN